MAGSLAARWQRLTTRRKVIASAVVVTAVAIALVIVLINSDIRLDSDVVIIDPMHPERSYFLVFLLIALDAVMPIFPGETTLNAAATIAAQGKLDLVPIIVMGALGAIVGDSSLFWIARKFSPRIQRQLTRAKNNKQVAQAFDLLDKSAPVLIIGGRYLPGMRFVVNATMGLSGIPYGRFLPWSIISGALWSTYTCVLAYQIGLALGDYPLTSFLVSGLVTTVVLAVVFLTVRRNRRAALEQPPQPGEPED